MELPIFEAPKHKIKTAKEHIGQLQCEVAQFIARNPYQIVVEQHRNTLDDAFVIRVREQIPEVFAA